MKYSSLAFGFLVLPWAVFGGAPDKLAVVEKPPDYLFLIDNSVAFERYRDRAEKEFFGLLASGLQGRFAPGTCFTIWTFNESVETKGFPIIEWQPDQSLAIANYAADYLRHLEPAGNSRWRPALVAAFSAIKSLPHLTLIILTDGHRSIEGTPYDDKINEVYRKFALAFHEDSRAFITTLVGQNHQIVGAAVNAAGETLRDPTPDPTPPATAKSSKPTAEVVVEHPPPVADMSPPAKIAEASPSAPKIPDPKATPNPDRRPDESAPKDAAPNSEPLPEAIPINPPASQVAVTQSHRGLVITGTRKPGDSAANSSSKQPTAATPHTEKIGEPSSSPTGNTATNVPTDLEQARPFLRTDAAPATVVPSARATSAVPHDINAGDEVASHVVLRKTQEPAVTPASAQPIPLPARSERAAERWWYFWVGGLLLGTASGLLVFLVVRHRPPPRPSIITQSFTRHGEGFRIRPKPGDG